MQKCRDQLKEKGNEDDNKVEIGSDVEIIHIQNGERNLNNKMKKRTKKIKDNENDEEDI